jgi:hypothetical protein
MVPNEHTPIRGTWVTTIEISAPLVTWMGGRLTPPIIFTRTITANG